MTYVVVAGAVLAWNSIDILAWDSTDMIFGMGVRRTLSYVPENRNSAHTMGPIRVTEYGSKLVLH